MRILLVWLITTLFSLSVQAAQSSGSFLHPAAGQSFDGNLLVSVQVADSDGLNAVFITFDEQPARLYLCQSRDVCQSNFRRTLSDINPAISGLNPGVLTLTLWAMDTQGNVASLDNRTVTWQPPSLGTVEVSRSADGTSLDVSWQSSPGLLRYNLYLASQSGVNRSTYRQLPDGQARLAVRQPPQSFTGLDPLKTYYLLVTGLSGAGESALSGQITLPAPDAPPNAPPIASDDAYSTSQDQPLVVPAVSGLLVNDLDPDGDPLTVANQPASPPASGSLDLQADGSFSYTPDAGFTGQDSFSYTVLDGKGGSAQAQVTVDVTAAGINNPPDAVDDSYSLLQDQVLMVPEASGLLANDSDADGDALTVDPTPAVMPVSGSLDLNGDGSFTYSPDPGFVGQDSFTYDVLDGNGGVSQAEVSIEVTAIPGDILGDSLSITGDLLYTGLGEETAGGQIGTGRYRIGNCIQVIDTRCTMVGRYEETDLSGQQPGAQGSYAFVMTYPGIGPSPVLARSVVPNSNSLQFYDVGGATFALSLFPDQGGIIQAQYPAVPFDESIDFFAFITNPVTCNGLPVGNPCSIGEVGKVVDASLTAPLDRLEFTIPGIALVEGQSAPQAEDDQFLTGMDQVLTVEGLGVLANDLDADGALQGDSLVIRNSLNPGIGSLVGLAVDEYRQLLYLYPSFGASVQVLDRQGTPQGSFTSQGEAANDVDLDVAPRGLMLGDTQLAQGTLLQINGETGIAEIYAIDPQSGTLLAQLDPEFGSSHVVGGVYNPVSQSLFLIQDNVPAGAEANRVAEIDPQSGLVLGSFNLDPQQYSVSFGDIGVNQQTGHLYLVSSIRSEMAEYDTQGTLIRTLPLPAGVGTISGLAVNASGDLIWMASTSGQVFELGLANQASLPTLTVTLVQEPAHGTLTLEPGGGFQYTPATGFTGQDSFTYQVRDSFGLISLAQASIQVQ
ncbi:Ig-like domain-containing protein [Bowmanella dokdonensis]|uniref:Tandem-95 repeat protein n=1 Tax=Bowmanella dokdonensis TaxID=751969 RepID=A0A939DMH1_9ALTE|nr:Ig-like domain-containing protein [Bowmanella dokdonensis]MBN7825352.1 tandem-95 repeat protein [Bowmanella dokdonensis]